MNDQVRLTIERVNIKDLLADGEVLLDITETTETVLARAQAWAAVRGYERVQESLERALGSPGPSGWGVVINKPNSLVFLATWPWCEGPHDLLTLWGMHRT